MSLSLEAAIPEKGNAEMSVPKDEDEVKSFSDTEKSKSNAPSESCLLCGSCDERSYEMESANRVKWTLHFCQLFRIEECALVAQTTKAEMWTLMQSALYCSDCMDSLERISHLLQTIEDINAQLRVIQLQCEAKLRAAKQNLHDPHEVKRRRSLWTCMRVGEATQSGADRDLPVTGNELPSTSMTKDKVDWNVNQKNPPHSGVDTDSDCDFDSSQLSPLSTVPIQVIQGNQAETESEGERERSGKKGSKYNRRNREPLKARYKLRESSNPAGRLKSEEQESDGEKPGGNGECSDTSFSSSAPPTPKPVRRKRKLKRILRIESDSDCGKKTEKARRRSRVIKRKKTCGGEERKSARHGEWRMSCPFAPECKRLFHTKAKRDEHVVLVHEGKKFTCELCGQSYGLQKLLEEHGNIHKGLTPFKCEECPQEFAMSHHRRIHKLNVHSDRPFKCEPCGKAFITEANFQKHLNSPNHHQKGKEGQGANCKDAAQPGGLAPQQTVQPSGAAKERKKPFGRSEWGMRCPFAPECKRQFHKKAMMDEHVALVHEGKKFVCETCGQSYGLQKLLDEHGNIHKGLTPFKCQDCPQEFAMSHHLRMHKLNSHSDRPFKCGPCGKAFVTEANFQKHCNTPNHQLRSKLGTRWKEASEPGKPRAYLPRMKLAAHKCPFPNCNKSYTLKYSLTTHLRTHDDSIRASLTCSFCQRTFETKHSLKQHEALQHTGKASFRCEQCPFLAMNKFTLQKHMDTVHSEERPVQCDICGHTFKHTSYLRQHKQRSHPQSKDHMCSVCGKCFSNKRYLQEHDETHKEIKSFLCPQCGRGFTQKTSLNKHLRSVHKMPGGGPASKTKDASAAPSADSGNQQAQGNAAHNQFPPELLSFYTPAFPPF